MLSETTQAPASQSGPITGGPSREELFDSLRLYRPGSPYTVIFTVEKSTKYRIVITALEREDGSGQSWNFKGFVEYRHPMDQRPKNVRGSYNSRTRRQGTIEFVE